MRVDRDEPYYRADLSLAHDRGFGFHADMCAPGLLGSSRYSLRTVWFSRSAAVTAG
jgi:hypothetical protein